LKEIGALKKQQEEGEKTAKELTAVIVNELSVKLKAVIKINQ
jgi:hypothetical protein